MKKFFLFFVIALFSIPSFSQTDNTDYNPQLADSLGADEYGMKTYVFVILKTGPAVIDDSDKRAEIFEGHLNNMRILTEMGLLVVAGPFINNEKNYRGIFIFQNASIEETKVLLRTDPAIQAQLLEAEIYEWYGSAALPTYLENHKKIEKSRP